MMRPPPSSTRTDTLCPYTTLFRSRGRTAHLHCRVVIGSAKIGMRDKRDLRLDPEPPDGLRREHGHFDELLDTGIERRSEEHTYELQSLMRISYAVYCLKKKKHSSYNI